jgi:molecular chaperone GrpE
VTHPQHPPTGADGGIGADLPHPPADDSSGHHPDRQIHGDDEPTTDKPTTDKPTTDEPTMDEPNATAADGDNDEIDTTAGLLAALTAVSAERDEYLSDLQRLQADFENYRKRVTADTDRARDTAVRDAHSTLLPVLDELDRLCAAQLDPHASAAVGAVARAVTHALATLELTRVGEAGHRFDPNQHEAVSVVDRTDDEPPGTIRQVLRPGWAHRDHVLRPALVEVTA